MAISKISGEARPAGGRHANERLRRRGMIPAVIYGHGEAPESVAISLRDLEYALASAAHVVDLGVGGGQRQLLLKDVQYDHLHRTPIHADLMRVDANERVRVKVPLEFRGTPKGLRDGGNLVHVLDDLDIECLLLKIPEVIRADVADLAMNQGLHIRELQLPADVTVLHEPDDLVAIVRPARAAEVVAAVPGTETTTAEPEVIKKGKEETAEDAAK